MTGTGTRARGRPDGGTRGGARREEKKKKEKPTVPSERRGAFRDALRSFHVAASVALRERRAARDAERETKAALARTGRALGSLTPAAPPREKSSPPSLRKNLEFSTEALGGEARGVVFENASRRRRRGPSRYPKGDVLLSRGVDAGRVRGSTRASLGRRGLPRLLARAFPRCVGRPRSRHDADRVGKPTRKTKRSISPRGATRSRARRRNRARKPPRVWLSLTRKSRRGSAAARRDGRRARVRGDRPLLRRASALGGRLAVPPRRPPAVEGAQPRRRPDTATTPTALRARAQRSRSRAWRFGRGRSKTSWWTRRALNEDTTGTTRATSKRRTKPAFGECSSRETANHLGSVLFMGELVKFRALRPEWADFLKGVDAFAGRALTPRRAAGVRCVTSRGADTARRTDASSLDVFLGAKR